MDRLLTREQVEAWRMSFKSTYPETVVSYTEARRQLDLLCDLALQSLSQEAVRDEALEEAAKMCEAMGEHAERNRDYCMARGEIGPASSFNGGFATAGTCAYAIRALKREPNAAIREDNGEIAYAMSMTDDGPAPAAPDVASMVKRLEQADRTQRIANCHDEQTLYGDAAALLARLGQGWIPVSEMLPGDDRTPVLVNYRAAFHTRKFASGTAKRNRVMFAIFSGGKWRFTLKHEKTRISERVTHWMPLPPATGASDD